MLSNKEVEQAIFPAAVELGARLRAALVTGLSEEGITVSAVEEAGPDKELVADEYSVSVNAYSAGGEFTVGWKLSVRDGADDGQPGMYGLVVEIEDPECNQLVHKRLSNYTDDLEALKAEIDDHDITEDVNTFYDAAKALAAGQSPSP